MLNYKERQEYTLNCFDTVPVNILFVTTTSSTDIGMKYKKNKPMLHCYGLEHSTLNNSTKNNVS